jgi:glycosyltransferase involved in cell wall biosynthesis
MLVPPERVPELADAITKMLSDSELRARIAAAGAETARSTFSWAAIAERTHRLFAGLLGRSSEASSPSLASSGRGR